MAVKYYIKRGSKKVYAVPNTLMAVQNMAQREADKIGRAVSVFGEEAGRAGRAVAKAYNRNPAKKKGPYTRPYYMLYTYEGNSWGPQFGDFDKDVVLDESVDSYSHLRASNRKIVKLANSKRATADAMTAKLNR
jgi:hypothetical protein